MDLVLNNLQRLIRKKTKSLKISCIEFTDYHDGIFIKIVIKITIQV